jgi:hypothetical protein
MGSCLNVLNEPEHFLLAATLIALVLLVWAQLGAPKDKGVLDRDMNLWFGILWTYAALFVVLIALALFIYNNTCDCAKGFLILSFLMTIANILMVLGLNFIKIVFHKPSGESLTGVCISSGLWAKGWILFWLFLLAGLVFISFSLVGVWFCRFLQITIVCWSLQLSWQFILGLVLVGMALLVGICFGFKKRKCRLCTWFRRGWWKNGEGVDENGGKCGE